MTPRMETIKTLGLDPGQPSPLELLAEVVANVDLSQMTKHQTKDATLTIRLTPEEKDDISKTAKKLKMSAAEYLTQLHHLASSRVVEEVDKHYPPLTQ